METKITPDAVREAATQSHMSLDAFLRAAKVSRSTFWRFMHGKGTPHPVTLRKLADAIEAGQ